MALGQRARVDQVDRLVGKVEQADGVRDVGSAPAEPSRQRRGGQLEIVEQDGDRPGFFDRREVLADDVLDQRDLERVGSVERGVDQRRDRRVARLLRGAPAALAGDDLEPAVLEPGER